MNADIKRTLVDTFGRISYLFVIFFFFIYILYLHNEVPEALKEAWSASLSFLSVLATLFSAYIATTLFNDWKIQHNAQIKTNYINDILKIMRQDLIRLAPMLANSISAGEKFQNTNVVYEIKIDKKIIEELYSSHKTADLIFQEYYSSFSDVKTYLLYLRYSTIIEKSLIYMFQLEKIESNLEKSKEITQQLHRISFPKEIEEKTIKYEVVDLLPIDVFRQVEVDYFKITDHITKSKLQ